MNSKEILEYTGRAKPSKSAQQRCDNDTKTAGFFKGIETVILGFV